MSSDGVGCQLFDSSADPLGDEFYPYATETLSQTVPKVKAIPSGGFVVSFQEYNPDINFSWDIYVRWYDNSGTPLTDMVVANLHRYSSQ